MEKQNTSSSQGLEIHEKLLLGGQIMTIIGSAFLSFGQIFKMLKQSEIPTKPILETKDANNSSIQNTNLYSRSRSYFD